MNPYDFPISLLRLFDMELFTYNRRDGVSKIWILMKRNIYTHRVFSSTDQEFTLDLVLASKSFRITFVHANVHASARRRLRQLFPSLAPIDLLWLLIGDFNAIIGAHERHGGNMLIAPLPMTFQR